ncbi:MAG: cupin domain-containing protein [Planctomycetota bacterium]|nr:MAG: cupin domain-containing protein [Planctomycetota bacterium]
MAFVDTSLHRRFDPAKLQKINLFDTPQMFCDVYCLKPGQAQKVHSHADATKFYFVLEGTATITIGGETREMGPGELAWSAAGEPHGVENRADAPLRLLVSMAPNPNK